LSTEESRVERHGRRWRWRARANGRIVTRSWGSPDEARSELDRFLSDREKLRNHAIEAQRRRTTIAELCEAWFIDKKPKIAPATAQQYGIHIRVHIKPTLGQDDANLIRPRELEAFYASLRWKPAKESHNILRQAFDWGLRNEVLVRPSNPCLVVRPSRRACTDHDGFFDTNDRISLIDEKLIPTRVEIEKLLADAEARHDGTWWLFLKLAATTGARPGEVCALRLRDFDLERCTIHIQWSADRISGKLKRPKTRWSIRAVHMESGGSSSRSCRCYPRIQTISCSRRTPTKEPGPHCLAGTLEPSNVV
jgi:integrase